MKAQFERAPDGERWQATGFEGTVMTNAKNSLSKKPGKRTLAQVTGEMAKPRVTASARAPDNAPKDTPHASSATAPPASGANEVLSSLRNGRVRV